MTTDTSEYGLESLIVTAMTGPPQGGVTSSSIRRAAARAIPSRGSRTS